jgi:hypothetical protein
MSITPVCGYLNAVQARAEEIFRDGMMKNDYIADVVSAQAILEQQAGVTSIPSITGTKNKEVRVEWNTKCEVSTTACTDDCSIDGEDITPHCTDYELECLRETTFKVPERLYRDKNIEKSEAVAKNMILHKNAMDTYIAQYVLAQLVANAGANAFTGGGMNVLGTTTFVPPGLWDDSIWGYFNQVVRLNKFRQPYLLTGNNLYQLLFNRPLEAANAQGGAANVRKINTLKVYQDPENIESVAPLQSILVHRGSAAFISKAWYPRNAVNAVNPSPGMYIWSEPSMNLPGVEYDIFMLQSCSGNEFYEAYKIQLHGLFALNPLPCNDRTGILVFECGTGA